MRALMNTSTTIQSAWSNGRSVREAACPRPICGYVSSMRVPGVSSKPSHSHWRGSNA